MRRWAACLALLPAVGAGSARAACTDVLTGIGPSDYHPQHVIVNHLGAIAPVQWQAAELPMLTSWPQIGASLHLVPVDPMLVVADLNLTGLYACVEPDLKRAKSATVNDPLFDRQWNFAEIRVPEAWDITTGNGARVAMLDTGLRLGGTDTPANVGAGIDFAYNDADPIDDDGHGTHCAGTVAAATNNAAGVAGVAPGATLVIGKVLDDSGSGYDSWVTSGILWAADQGADVINLSLGGGYGSYAERSACEYAWASGAILIAAAGNDAALSTIAAPARYESVVAVGATGYSGAAAPYSNRGEDLDLVAPGGDLSTFHHIPVYPDGILQEIYSTTLGWRFEHWEGTSMATPHVSGVAALLASLGASNQQIRDTLLATADDLGPPGFDTTFGHGRVNAAAAVQAFAPEVPSLPPALLPVLGALLLASAGWFLRKPARRA